MSPTFNHHGDIALVERLSVHAGRIRVGDVVVARSVQNVRHVVIKRVLGMEGDLVPVAGPRGRRYVTVPEGHVWLQGDNYHNSTDSRTYGPVPVAMVLGKVFYKVQGRSVCVDIGWRRTTIGGCGRGHLVRVKGRHTVLCRHNGSLFPTQKKRRPPDLARSGRPRKWAG